MGQVLRIRCRADGKRPVLLVIPAGTNSRFDGRWPNSCGQDAWDAVPAIRALIDAAHAKGLPVIYDRRCARRRMGPGKLELDRNAILDEIAPAPQDIVIRKLKPSGFYGTNLESFLTLLGADSLIVTGTTTSGCVRATVLDAFSSNYRMPVSTARRHRTPSIYVT